MISLSEFKEMIEEVKHQSEQEYLEEKALTYIPPPNREQQRLILVSDFVSFVQQRLQVVNSIELWKQTLFSHVQFDLTLLFNEIDSTQRGYLI